MRFFLVSLKLQLVRMLRRPGVWACLLAMPLLVLLAGMEMQGGGESALTVGVYLPESQRAGRVYQTLAAYEGDMRFVRADTVAELENGVAGGVWECGFVLPEDFDARAEANDWRGGIRMVTSPATSMAPLVAEVVSAALLREIAPDIALAFVESRGLLALDAAEMQALAAPFFAEMEPMHITVQGLAGQPTAEGGSARLALRAVLRGLVAVVLFLFALLCLVWYGQDRQSGFFARMRPYTGAAARVAPTLLAGLLPGAAMALAALRLGEQYAPGLWQGLGVELRAMGAYLVLLAGLTLLCGVFVRTARVLTALTPFLLVACLLLCPVLLDVGRYFPAAATASLLLPPTHYLRAAAGDGGCAVMLALGVACAAAGLLADKATRLVGKGIGK